VLKKFGSSCDSLKTKTPAKGWGTGEGGDGGNWTRVRTNRPSNFYKRSPFWVSPACVKWTKTQTSQSLRPESPLLCSPWRTTQHLNFVTSALLPVQERSRKTWRFLGRHVSFAL